MLDANSSKLSHLFQLVLIRSANALVGLVECILIRGPSRDKVFYWNGVMHFRRVIFFFFFIGEVVFVCIVCVITFLVGT